MSRSDPALTRAVQDFIDDLAPRIEQLASRVKGVDASRLRADVALEAYNLVAAIIDAEGLQSDDELWAFISTFAPIFGGNLLRATPDDVRTAGLVGGRSEWLTKTSEMFELIVSSDARDGTNVASVYYERALRLAHTVIALDGFNAQPELAAVERFRGLLLTAMTPTAQAGTPTGGATAPPPGSTAPDPPPDLPPPRAIEELMNELDDLIGLADVKREVRQVTDLLRVQKLREERGLPTMEHSRHLIFTGNPGTGKTTVARLLAEIYRTLGVVARGHLVETDRSGLVAGFVGQTATRVVEAFDRADEGVLLIDEAYSLVRGSESDFGREAIDTIVKLIEDRRDRIVVIAAGYPDEMSDFVDANPGLKSRFPKTIFFPDYTDDELLAIFEGLCEKNHYAAGTDTLDAVRKAFTAVPRDKGFGNGRLVRNLFEAAVACQASRIVTIDAPTDQDLVTLTPADVTAPGTAPG